MMYRKTGEKSSRSLKGALPRDFGPKNPGNLPQDSRFHGRFDRLLFFAALILFAGFLMVNLAFGKVNVIKKTSLVLSFRWEEHFGRDLMEALIGEFRERNPELLIRMESPAKNGSRAAAPDILLFGENEYGELAGKGVLASLGPYGYSGNGVERRAVPLVSFMDLLFYNINLLKAAGFDRPPKSRAEFLACAKAIAAGGGGRRGVYGVGLALGAGDPLSIRREIFSRIWASGASLFREGKPYFGGRAVVETLDFFERLRRDGSIAPGAFDRTGAELAADFAGGRIAMMAASVREIPELRKQMGDSAFGITVIPGAAEAPGQNRIALFSWYAGISAECAKADEAWTFLSFLAEKGSVLAARMEAAPGSLPLDNIIPHAGSFPDLHIRNDPFYSKAWEIYEAAETVDEFSGMPGAAEYEQIVREELAKSFGKGQAAETAAAIQKRWAALNDGIGTARQR